MRAEQEIFNGLEEVCASSGYIHVLAALCFRDTIVGFANEVRPEDLQKLFSPSTLIRTEINVLLGLMARHPIDFTQPRQADLSKMGERSDKLLHELHETMSAAGGKLIFQQDKLADPDYNPFANAEALREPIFYGGESAYTFQYRDLAPRKYASDAKWLMDNRKVDLTVCREVCKSLTDLLGDRLMTTLRALKEKPAEEWSMLDGFTFSSSEIAERIGIAAETVRTLIEAFCLPGPEANAAYTTLHAFNAVQSYPILRKGPDEFVLFQAYGLTEALYDAPFYWMGADKEYAKVALKHRGDFAEDFSYERLAKVFGAPRVFKNVEIIKGKGATLGEIDVLVIFGDCALVLQAKSKKLTLEARNGNDLRLKGDFKAAVQDAVDQAIDCARWLGDPSVTFRCRDGVVISIKKPRLIFPVAIVTDHYPALAFQARQLLKYKTIEQNLTPLVIDVFALDAMTEMLETPLRLLSYLWLRGRQGDVFMTSHEHTLLGYHLQNNLWAEDGVDIMMIGDDVSTPLDIAMLARRDDAPGARTPKGILTKFVGTPFEKLLSQIEHEENSPAISMGLMLLEMGEEAVEQLNKNITHILDLYRQDGKHHDMTLGLADSAGGLTIHVNDFPPNEAEERLFAHCRRRKYVERATQWHGVVLRPDGSIHLAAALRAQWKYDADLQSELAKTKNFRNSTAMQFDKIGRNALCPCGSGKKYKKCCIR
ncbi:SEC-C metal-binding domain-containing protein [Rhizobium laguerreae]|uniref:SEC-C motif-containing protein n=1 Tax=Rhizobium laguerreae TaxID=1076926 RepID=A0AAX2QBJ7_9HYPH|nr:SEC-C metal-binding domain-containing protein [Rhizobium laguerreae]MBY3278486.1 prepilin peptidase [Rhizobium laguerreae]NKM41306.1 prepilin peptidase [Rhizobium laguerreae]NKN08930.1 prepilin peptidase [Rhizobium laguerreae]TCU14507.1 SEC-C motif-containing protein [Rhizobium laguerreae]